MKRKRNFSEEEVIRLVSRLKNETGDYPEDLREQRRKIMMSTLPIIAIESPVVSPHIKPLPGNQIAPSVVVKVGIILAAGLSLAGLVLFWEDVFPIIPSTPTHTMSMTHTPVNTCSPTSTAIVTFSPEPSSSGKRLGHTPTPPGQRPKSP